MAKMVFLGVPAYGHVNPSLAVVQEVCERGHEIVYYNTEAFRSVIEATGAAFRPYPIEVSIANVSQLQQSGNLAAVTAMLLEVTERLLPAILDDLRREAPDLLIYDSLALWGSLAAQLLGIPSVASITHFIFEGTALRPSPRETLPMISMALPFMPRIISRRRRLRRRYGNQVFQPGSMLPVRGDRSILYTSAALQPASTWIDESFHFVGPSINPAARPAGDFPFEWLTGAPLIYISLGTIHHANTAFYRTCFEAFGDFPGQVVLSMGSSVAAADLGAVPANFLLRSSVPQLEILKRANVFVTHGGMNSIHEGLYYGVPLLVIPQQVEQLLNARIVAQHGAALLRGGPFSPDVTALELKSAVERIMVDASYRQRAQKIGQTLREAGGYQRAADAITAAVSSANPVLDR